MAVSTTSLQLRQEGNKLYSSATDDFSPGIQEERLKRAIYYYDQALKAARNKQERCSALKNYGMANWKMAKLVGRSYNQTTESMFYFKQGIKKLS